MNLRLKMSAVAVALAMSSMAQAAGTLDEVVVTAPQSAEPLTVKTNPKKPRQPVPAHDGADYLKTIPASPSSAKAARTAIRCCAAWLVRA